MFPDSGGVGHKGGGGGRASGITPTLGECLGDEVRDRGVPTPTGVLTLRKNTPGRTLELLRARSIGV